MEHQASSEPQHVSYRSGAAARLAGLSPETLRVWERRYNLSNTERSERGQRLYSAEQVRKLSLLKQLVDQGHAIGVLALMPDANCKNSPMRHTRSLMPSDPFESG